MKVIIELEIDGKVKFTTEQEEDRVKRTIKVYSRWGQRLSEGFPWKVFVFRPSKLKSLDSQNINRQLKKERV